LIDNFYINRELSWLEFNHRVLREVIYEKNPLFEKLNFAAIVCSNLDEFFMVRVASVQDQIDAGLNIKDPSGLEPRELIDKISKRAHRMMRELYQIHNNKLIQDLEKEKIKILKYNELNQKQKEYLDDYFDGEIYPVLTPMVVDKGRPFPLVFNKSLNIALLVSDKSKSKEIYFATVQVPSVLNRLIELPGIINKEREFILLEDIIKNKLIKIFNGYHVYAKSCYRVTRNADLNVDEEGAEDLLIAIEESLRQRRRGAVIRLEIEKNANKLILENLMKELEVKHHELYFINGPIDLNYLKKITSLIEYRHLRFSPIEPVTHKAFLNREDYFEAIRNSDILLYHPYHSFAPIIELIKQASTDPKVLAIKQTLYRVSDQSPIVQALANAAENGKQVTVMLEIKARFDEQNNINWAKNLETAGCHVIYGFANIKTHCKVLLIVRREEDGIRRYIHLGTGNYNDVTARLYTDISLITSNPYYGMDASNLFNMLSGLSQPKKMHRLNIAPYELRKKMYFLIQREKKNKEKGKRAVIIAKMNSLVDKGIIDALCDASSAGVEIKLIIRGICCLRPGVLGRSDNITVFSIVGRFLEHSRMYYFYNDGHEDIYLSSADMMSRNLDRRIETLFPVDSISIKDEIKEFLNILLTDTEKAKKLYTNGSYHKVSIKDKDHIASQEATYQKIVCGMNTIEKHSYSY